MAVSLWPGVGFAESASGLCVWRAPLARRDGARSLAQFFRPLSDRRTACSGAALPCLAGAGSCLGIDSGSRPGRLGAAIDQSPAKFPGDVSIFAGLQRLDRPPFGLVWINGRHQELWPGSSKPAVWLCSRPNGRRRAGTLGGGEAAWGLEPAASLFGARGRSVGRLAMRRRPERPPIDPRTAE